MAEKQEIHNNTAPPPYAPQAQPGYPPHVQPGYPPQAQPGYPPQGHTWYPPQGQPGYPPQGQPGHPQQGQQGYPPQAQPGYPPQAQPGYAFSQPPAPPIINTTTNVNVTVKSGDGPTIVAAPFPSDHHCLAWFSCVCFLPLGICAVVNSNNARSAILSGDLLSATRYSMAARRYAYMAIVAGIIMYILIVIISSSARRY